MVVSWPLVDVAGMGKRARCLAGSGMHVHHTQVIPDRERALGAVLDRLGTTDFNTNLRCAFPSNCCDFLSFFAERAVHIIHIAAQSDRHQCDLTPSTSRYDDAVSSLQAVLSPHYLVPCPIPTERIPLKALRWSSRMHLAHSTNDA